jgi:hypothetical protein
MQGESRMTCEHARELMAAEWSNENTNTEAIALRDHLDTCAQCSADALSLGSMWEQLAAIPVPEPSQNMQAKWRATLRSLHAPEPSRMSKVIAFWPRNPAWQVTIAAACLVAGLLIGTNVSRNSVTHGAVTHDNQEIARLRQEVADTREMVALSLLQQESATERIRGVNYADRLRAMDPEVLSALTTAVAHDPSVNVRLAAIDALSKASSNEAVLASLTQSLPRQNSPLVQAALIDYLVDARDRGAVGTLRQLVAQPDLNPSVLERAHFALQQLSH